MSFRLRKNDSVQVITGEFKGKTGKIIKVFPEKNRALVEGLNIVKRHTKPNRNNQQGGIVQKEAPLSAFEPDAGMSQDRKAHEDRGQHP